MPTNERVLRALTVRQVAEVLRVHPNTVYSCLDRGGVFPNAFKVTKEWRIPRGDLQSARNQRGWWGRG